MVAYTTLARVSSPSDAAASPPIQHDVQLLLTAAAAGASDAILQHLVAAGFGDLRPSHGYVFQHLVLGPQPIGELASRLGMTPQGASKAVIDLERLGYVRRQPAGDDRRAHLVELTARGHAAIQAGRAARASFTADVERLLGARTMQRFMASLRLVAEQSGGLAVLSSRRLRPPR
jgi:DNA-binding MarR family transcriptional regulator